MLLTESNLVNKARDLAKQYHRGQTDKVGNDYFRYHLTDVVKKLANPKEKIVGWLHDILEDTEMTVEKLREEGFPEDIIGAIVAVTKKPGENYIAFVKRAAAHGKLAKAVKHADIEDHLDRQDRKRDFSSKASLKKRYIKAIEFVQ